ncbi:unnamed protein product [Porites evermanni]|uniref:Uncharacterized protein n=1 Tax=Porites evermanni TaxID=104178 RepID=A0ABN8S4Q6_9CNID|nr:unnamed protein product [Porites evermanni]
MSHVVQEANLSCSAGKNGQSVRRSSTRSRKPNSSLDQEAVTMERIRELRKRRGGVLSALTAKRKEIDSLLTDENNLEAVKVKLTEITSLFQRFTDAHEEYNAALIDESQRQESVVYFTDIESSLNFFCQTVNDWLRVTEIRIHDLDVTPDDSVSQTSFQLRNRKRSGCGSAYSRSSRASSISVARAKEAARIAELQAEVNALKQRQLINESELWLKKEELDLKFKRDQLKLETEFKKAVARESAPKEHKTKHKVPSQSSSDSDEQSGLSDQAFHILEQQNRVMEEFVNQQQKNTLPRRQVPIFDGNPLSYCTFMRAFETVIESNKSDSGGRLLS